MPLCAGQPAVDAETAAGRAAVGVAVGAATAAFGVVADVHTAIAAAGLQLLLPWPIILQRLFLLLLAELLLV